MSNKIVPNIYRAVIDDVISNIKSEFDEYGVGEDVLAELQRKWEAKVIASHVADFEPPAPQAVHHPPPPQPHHPQLPPVPAHPSHPSHPSLPQHPYAQPYIGYPYPPPAQYHPPPPPPATAGQVQVKQEPSDGRWPPPMAAPAMQHPHYAQYAPPPPPHHGIPSLPGPQIVTSPNVNPNVNPNGPPKPGGTVMSFGPSTRAFNTTPQAKSPVPPAAPAPAAAPATNGASKIPQVDGPSSSESSGSASPTPPPSSYPPNPNLAYAPRGSAHPSLPQPAASSSGARPGSGVPVDEEAINSDLDDSDSEGERDDADGGGAAESDIVFCTYDKVARVKNKWKCILKDGMIHVNGKDYLFAKCTGEFEW